MKIGFIGVGAMGTPMALNLARHGNTVAIYDISPQRLSDPELAAATTVCRDIAGLTKDAELIITMTPNDDALLQIAATVAGAPRHEDLIFVDMSSTSLDATRRADAIFKEAGIVFLDGAIYGLGVQGARDGRSPIVISGPKAAYERIASAIEPLGSIDYVGELGRAKIVKILNNQLVGAFCVAAAEIVTIGLAGGLPLEKIVESLAAGSGSSYIMERYYGSFVKNGSFGLGLIPISYMIKDLTLACELAQEVHSAATLTELSRQIYQAAANVVGDLPFPEVYSFYAQLNGLREAVPA
jgi:2-hydroxymethylglutarate dehydrogenase